MKTPEEIKKGLGRCGDITFCDTCENSFICQNEEDALAYIKQLEANQPMWISVEERLPQKGQWVLTYCGGYANWFELNKWCEDNWLKIMPVTHWMPLPEPQKEDV